MRRASILLVLLALLPGAAPAQSLADAAKKEAERRKKAQASASPAPVITNDDLKSTGGRLANDPNAPPAVAPAAATATPPAGQAPSQEAYWRARATQAAARLEVARKNYENTKGQTLPPLTQGTAFRNRRTGAPIDANVLQKATADAKAELDAAQKALDDLQESARRAGVPPGWVR